MGSSKNSKIVQYFWRTILRLSLFFFFFFEQTQILIFLRQLALRWQLAKQLSGFNPLSLRNNKTTNIAVKPTMGWAKVQLSQKYHWESFKISGHKHRF